MKNIAKTPLMASTLTRMAVGFLTILAIVAACAGAIACVGWAFQWASSFIENPNQYLLWVPKTDGTHLFLFTLGFSLILWGILVVTAIFSVLLLVSYLLLQISPLCLEIGTVVLAKMTGKRVDPSC